MQFYCPVCIQTVDLPAETTLVTKLNQHVSKAHCPTCQQEVVIYGAQGESNTLPTTSTTPDANPQDAVDQALKDFGSAV